jgi:cell wall assembly regulator SMI1
VWSEWLSHVAGPALVLRPGCDQAQIESAESSLGVSLPSSLVELLGITDGFVDVKARYECAWQLARIVEENQRAWSDRSTGFPNDLLGFGSDGAGDWFCLSLRGQAEARVYHWSWITLEAREIASNLVTFWPGWLDGSIAV